MNITPAPNTLFDFSQHVFLDLDSDANRRMQKFSSVDELYQFHEVVGEGSFSRVYRATFLPTQDVMAVKVRLNFLH